MEKKLLAVASIVALAPEAFIGAAKVEILRPRTRDEKLSALGLTVNTKETATAVRFSYGQKPPIEKPNGRAALRRLRQMNREQFNRVAKSIGELAAPVSPSPERATTAVSA